MVTSLWRKYNKAYDVFIYVQKNVIYVQQTFYYIIF